jgi:hypothetical protein
MENNNVNTWADTSEKCNDPKTNSKMEEYYYTLLENLMEIIPVPQKEKSFAQQHGIDKIFVFIDGTLGKVEEKIRYQVYDDILIEIESNNTKHTRGWIYSDYMCNIIVYYIAPIEKMFIFDWKSFKAMWDKFGEEWKLKYGIVTAMNNGYYSSNVPVPIDVVLQHLNCYQYPKESVSELKLKYKIND